jgi:hypothetical protein
MSEQDPSVTNLPEKPEITRRDFVGGTLVGTGCALRLQRSSATDDLIIAPQGRVLESEYECSG